MNGYAMYEVAKLRVAEQQRGARRAADARERRAAARTARRARKEGPDVVATPAIPDFAHEMFAAVPAPRREEPADGRRAGTSR